MGEYANSVLGFAQLGSNTSVGVVSSGGVAWVVSFNDNDALDYVRIRADYEI